MRSLSPILKKQLDDHFGTETLVLSPAGLLIRTAQFFIGVTSKDVDMINLIRSTVTKPWNEPWCDDFVQTCVAYVESVKGIQSPLPASESVLGTWKAATSKRISPQPGDMILWQLTGTQSGHCGIVTASDSLLYYTIEGNTSDTTAIDRNGNGVFAKKRAKGGTKTFAQLGFICLFPDPINQSGKSLVTNQATSR